jgi:hypothetical protein
LLGSCLEPPESGGYAPLGSNTHLLGFRGKLRAPPVDLIDTRVSSVSFSDSDVVPLVASLRNAWANMVVSVAGPANCTAALLTDNEVPYLGILDIVSNTGNTGPTVDRLVVPFGYLDTKKIPLLFNKQQCNN